MDFKSTIQHCIYTQDEVDALIQAERANFHSKLIEAFQQISNLKLEALAADSERENEHRARRKADMHAETKIIELKRRLKSETMKRRTVERKFSRFETILKAEFNPDSSRTSFQRTRSPSLEIIERRSNSIIIEDDGDSDIEVVHPQTPVPTTTALPPHGEISPSTSVADREYEAYDLEWLKRRCTEAATDDRGMQDMTHGSNPSGSDASNGANAITTPRTSASVTIEPEERWLKREESLTLSVLPFEDTLAEGHTMLEYIDDPCNEDSPLPEEIPEDDMKIGRRGSVQGLTVFELSVPFAPTFARPETPFSPFNNAQAACSLSQIPPTPPSTINPMRSHTASAEQDEEGILIDETNLNKRKRKSNIKSLQILTKKVKSTSNACAGIMMLEVMKVRAQSGKRILNWKVCDVYAATHARITPRKREVLPVEDKAEENRLAEDEMMGIKYKKWR